MLISNLLISSTLSKDDTLLYKSMCFVKCFPKASSSIKKKWKITVKAGYTELKHRGCSACIASPNYLGDQKLHFWYPFAGEFWKSRHPLPTGPVILL